MAESVCQITEHANTFEIASFSGNMMLSDAGTFNSISCSSTIEVNLNERWLGFGLFDNFDDCVQQQYKLPLNYVAGTDISVIVNWQASVTSGNCYYTCGLGGIDSGGQWASDADMEYAAIAAYTVAGTTSQNNIQTFTFSGSGYTAGEELVIAIYRQALTSLNDTLAGTMRIFSVAFKYQINSLGTTNAS